MTIPGKSIQDGENGCIPLWKFLSVIVATRRAGALGHTRVETSAISLGLQQWRIAVIDVNESKASTPRRRVNLNANMTMPPLRPRNP